jgi:hypothetical protein
MIIAHSGIVVKRNFGRRGLGFGSGPPNSPTAQPPWEPKVDRPRFVWYDYDQLQGVGHRRISM